MKRVYRSDSMKRGGSDGDFEGLPSVLPTTQEKHKRGAASSGMSRRRQVVAGIMALAMLFMVIRTVGLFRSNPDPNKVATLAMARAKLEIFQQEKLLKRSEKAKLYRELALSVSHFAQLATTPRGVVLPLFDGIAHLGMSLLLELRASQVDLPIEIPHCGDFKPEFQQMIESRDPFVRVYDVCAQALNATNLFNTERRLFCETPDQCRTHFRSFNIKILSVVFSQFEEVMLLDADTLFFQSPMPLWDTPKYTRTGTLFFHDRISYSEHYLAERIADTEDRQQLSRLHVYLSKFDVSPYHSLGNIPREKKATAEKSAVSLPVALHFEASKFLLSSHSWNLRAGHEMDSSLVLWNKSKQPRATAILASFVALNNIPFPPSYGDKELFFLACELAETQYSFSDFGVGSLGTDLRADGEKPDSVLCGGGLHYFPVKPPPSTAVEPSAIYEDVQMLYLNSDDILTMDADKDKIYRTVARPADFYAGSFRERNIVQECPFDIQALAITAEERQKIARRQRFHQTVRSWTSGSPHALPKAEP